MGRPPFLPGQLAPRLTPKQREMLAQTIFAGCCVSFPLQSTLPHGRFVLGQAVALRWSSVSRPATSCYALA